MPEWILRAASEEVGENVSPCECLRVRTYIGFFEEQLYQQRHKNETQKCDREESKKEKTLAINSWTDNFPPAKKNWSKKIRRVLNTQDS